MAGLRGIEPRLSEPESDVMPLDHNPVKLERAVGIEPTPTGWKPIMLAVKHQARVVKSFP